jgi:hypothetical protein
VDQNFFLMKCDVTVWCVSCSPFLLCEVCEQDITTEAREGLCTHVFIYQGCLSTSDHMHGCGRLLFWNETLWEKEETRKTWQKMVCAF